MTSRPDFDLGKPFIARKEFSANGHKLVPGNEIQWTRWAISKRRMAQLYDGRFICNVGDDEEMTQAADPVEPDPETATDDQLQKFEESAVETEVSEAVLDAAIDVLPECELADLNTGDLALIPADVLNQLINAESDEQVDDILAEQGLNAVE